MQVSENKHAGRNGWKTLRTPKNQDPRTQAVLGLSSIPKGAPVIIYVGQHRLWKAGADTKIETVRYVFYKSIHDTKGE